MLGKTQSPYSLSASKFTNPPSPQNAHEHTTAPGPFGPEAMSNILYFVLSLLDGLAASTALCRRRGGWLTHQLSGPNCSNKLLHTMIVKINRSALGVRLGHHSHSVLLVPYGLPFDQCLHSSLRG